MAGRRPKKLVMAALAAAAVALSSWCAWAACNPRPMQLLNLDPLNLVSGDDLFAGSNCVIEAVAERSAELRCTGAGGERRQRLHWEQQ